MVPAGQMMPQQTGISGVDHGAKHQNGRMSLVVGKAHHERANSHIHHDEIKWRLMLEDEGHMTLEPRHQEPKKAPSKHRQQLYPKSSWSKT